MTRLAIIPARGGSKGIPRKNLADVAGRPLIAHTIQAGLAAASISRVVVSTDDAEIAEAARQSGAEVLMRPAEFASDAAPMLPVLQHAVAEIGGEFPAIVLLQPTSPLRTARHIDEAVALLDDGCDSVAAVCEMEHSPYKCCLQKDGLLVPFVPGADLGAARQLLPTVYRENGAIYAIHRAVIEAGHSLRGDRIRPYFMTAEESVDVDSPFDLALVSLLMEPRASTPTTP